RRHSPSARSKTSGAPSGASPADRGAANGRAWKETGDEPRRGRAVVPGAGRRRDPPRVRGARRPVPRGPRRALPLSLLLGRSDAHDLPVRGARRRVRAAGPGLGAHPLRPRLDGAARVARDGRARGRRRLRRAHASRVRGRGRPSRGRGTRGRVPRPPGLSDPPQLSLRRRPPGGLRLHVPRRRVGPGGRASPGPAPRGGPAGRGPGPACPTTAPGRRSYTPRAPPKSARPSRRRSPSAEPRPPGRTVPFPRRLTRSLTRRPRFLLLKAV